MGCERTSQVASSIHVSMQVEYNVDLLYMWTLGEHDERVLHEDIGVSSQPDLDVGIVQDCRIKAKSA